jgi:hypothetical protein
MPGQPFVQVDAFTRESFGRNPAAVFLLPAELTEALVVVPLVGGHAVTLLRGELT